ncbi:MAG: TIGR04283 family arsenosugar biosynthesis glycosyltransferase [Leptospirales bacterium]
MITVVVPVLNERGGIESCLIALEPLIASGHEVLFVDGGSQDGTCEFLKDRKANVLHSPPGRALQLNLGARAARGSVLLFLHADVRLPPGAQSAIERVLEEKDWGWFSARLTGEGLTLGIVARFMTWRSRLTGIATGDQGIFIRKRVFDEVGGYPEVPLMEDIRFCRKLKKHAKSPACLSDSVLISSRRWEKDGILRTVVLMWGLRLAHFLGASPRSLVRFYYGRSRS